MPERLECEPTIKALYKSTYTFTFLHLYNIPYVVMCAREGMNNQQVVDRLVQGFRHPQPADCPEALYNIMLDCWKKDAQQRPTFEHLFQTLDDFSVSVETGYKDPTLP